MFQGEIMYFLIYYIYVTVTVQFYHCVLLGLEIFVWTTVHNLSSIYSVCITYVLAVCAVYNINRPILLYILFYVCVHTVHTIVLLLTYHKPDWLIRVISKASKPRPFSGA